MSRKAKAPGRSTRNQRSRPVKNPQRRELAYGAARLMAEEHIAEFEQARRKAAERLGITDKRLWPDNEEIQTLLEEQQRLFGGAARIDEERALLEQALAAMQVFDAFHPRLVGAARAGAASRTQGLELYLFAETPEEVIWTLIDRHIPWENAAAQFRYANGERQEHPVLCFVAGALPIRLNVLPVKARRNPPLDPVFNRPERGASRHDLEAQLEALAPAMPDQAPLD